MKYASSQFHAQSPSLDLTGVGCTLFSPVDEQYNYRIGKPHVRTPQHCILTGIYHRRVIFCSHPGSLLANNPSCGKLFYLDVSGSGDKDISITPVSVDNCVSAEGRKACLLPRSPGGNDNKYGQHAHYSTARLRYSYFR